MHSGSRRGPHHVHDIAPIAHSQRPTTEDDADLLDEEEARQERIRLDTYSLFDKRQSGELHGIYYTASPEVSSPREQQDIAAQAQHMATSNSPTGLHMPRQGSVSGQLISCSEEAAVQGTEVAAAVDIEQQDQNDGKDNKVLELLEPISEATTGHPPLTLEFNRLSVWAPVNPKKASWAEKAWKNCISRGKAQVNPKRQILYDITGQVRPGEVLALMGPSGSGKTSLLTVLGGRSAMKYKGAVTVNGAPYSKATRRRIGFVLQDDVLFESLTVKETLTYAALLRLPGRMKREDKLQRVDTVVDALGLRKSVDTIIGGFFRRGISGGERKRVSIGHELLINPAIILLDEPTSGLDSTTAMHLLTLLQDLASGGRAVCTTIHQPSSRLYKKLDWLMLLAEGHMMYYGKADQVLDWFSEFGYKIPFGVSIADYILDISLGEAGYSKSGKTGQSAITELYTAFESRYMVTDSKQQGQQQLYFSSKPDSKQLPVSSKSNEVSSYVSGFGGVSKGLPNGSNTVSDTNNSLSDTRQIRVVGYNNGTGLQGLDSPKSTSSEESPNPSSCDMVIQTGGSNIVKGSSSQQHSGSSSGGKLERAYYWDQLKVLTQRAGRVRRFEQMTGQNFFQLFAVAFITGLVWWQRGQQYYGGVQAASDVLGLLFFILLFPSMRALFRALFSFPNDYRMLMKERPSGMYNLSAYYLSKMAADIPSEMINIVLFVVIAYWFGGLRHTAGAFFGMLFSMVLITAVAESWGLLIGGVFMEPKTAQTVTTVVMLAFLLVGGYYVRNIPVWIGWIRYLSFLYWGYNVVIKTQFSDVTYYTCANGSCEPVPLDQLALSTNPQAPAYPDVLILLGMLIFLRFCIYWVLRRKTRVQQKNIDKE